MSASKTVLAACACGRVDAKQRAVAYADCCGRYIETFSDHPSDHGNAVPAPDAEHLMRSRYSAFVRMRPDYLLATWHSRTRPASLDLDADTKWLGLDVRAYQTTGPDTAEVTFVARYRVHGRAVRLHERSRFVREDGRWFYVDGEHLG